MSNSYRFVLFLLFLFPLPILGYISHSSSPSYHSDEEALLAFKHSLFGGPNSSLLDWSPHHSFCNWTGVDCSFRHQRVVSLNLTGMSLVGPISPFLGNLSFLRVIAFRNNSFQGQIPVQLGRLFRLRMLGLSYNHLSGNIPSELGLLSYLETLTLGANQLIGTIPPSLGNLSSLIDLELAENRLHGGIPVELGMLTQLTVLYLHTNNLTREIPIALSNCSLLQNLSLFNNQLSGCIPWQFGKLSKLQNLYLWGNQLIGEIPPSLSNCTQLQLLSLELNQLSGTVPLDFGKLIQLQWLNLEANQLVSRSNKMSFLIALTNCSSLQALVLSANHFTGIFPSSISQLSSQLSILSVDFNQIEGNIPSGIGNLTKLTFIDLFHNNLNGTIPSTIGQLPNLESLYLHDNYLYGAIPESLGYAKRLGFLILRKNMISGQIPDTLGDLPQLRYLSLDYNQLSGKVPASLGRCITLELVDLSHNKLEGSLPLEWQNLNNLQFYFNVSSNFLQGFILVLSKMTMVQAIDMSLNNFLGEIPAALSSCTNLQYLNLSWNSFNGSIPVSLTNLKNLQDIDLSRNNLSGTIPMAFQEMKMLQHINLSSNNLTGEVPKGGVFASINESAISGNVGLCSKWINLKSCFDSKHKHFLVSRKVIVPTAIGISIFIMSSVLFLYFYKRRHTNQNTLEFNFGFKRISYEELVDATGGFSDTNKLGVGSFGSVYRGILSNGTNIAVKVFNLQDENSLQIFDKECNVLKRVRHRNVIKIISACSNLDFKALVLPFMSNGSLERWLYPEGGDECKLNLHDRLRIAKEIAQGMVYLHHHCFVQVIHCDLKPNNVLLGDDITPYIVDFGITKLLFGNSMDSLTSTNSLKGSTGYIAPGIYFGYYNMRCH